MISLIKAIFQVVHTWKIKRHMPYQSATYPDHGGGWNLRMSKQQHTTKKLVWCNALPNLRKISVKCLGSETCLLGTFVLGTLTVEGNDYFKK
jgi:hypothetical protein